MHIDKINIQESDEAGKVRTMDFSQLLDAAPAERAFFLEKITHITLYGRLSARIHEKTQDAQLQHQALLNHMEGIADGRRLDESTCQRKLEEFGLLENKIKLAEQELHLTQNRLHWKQQYEQVEQQLLHLKQKWTEAQNDYHQRMAQQIELGRYDELSPFLQLYHTINEKNRHIQHLKDLLNAHREALRHHQTATHEAQAAYSAAQTALQQARDLFNGKRDALRKGYELTSEQESHQVTLLRKEQTLQEKKQLLEERQREFTRNSEERDTCLKNLDSIRQAMNTMVVHRPLLERTGDVRDALHRIHEKILDIDGLRQKIDKENHRKEEMLFSLQELQAEAVRLEENVSAQQAQLKLHLMANEGQEAEAIQQKIIHVNKKETDARSALNLWNKICLTFDEIDTLDAAIRQADANLLQWAKERQKLEALLAERRKSCDNAYQSYLLSRNMNISELRAQLKEGTSCPVCGGTHHPFHSETEQALGELHLKLKEDFLAAEALLEQTRTDIISLDKQIAAATAALQEKQRYKDSTEQFLQADLNEWNHYAYLDPTFKDASVQANRATRAQMLALLLDNALRDKAISEKANQDFFLHQNEINRIHEEIRQLTVQQTLNLKQQHLIQARTEGCTALMDNHEQDIQTARNGIAEIMGRLEPLLTIPGWKEDIMADYNGLMGRLAQIAHDWQAHNEAMQQETHHARLTEAIQNGLTTQINSLQADCQALQDDILSLQEQIGKDKDTLVQLFGSETPSQTELRLSHAVAQARSHLQQKQESLQALQQETAAAQAAIDTLAQAQQHSEEQLKEAQTALDTAIAQFNASHPPVQLAELERIFSRPTDWNSLRCQLDQCRAALAKTQQQYDSKEEEFLGLKQSEFHFTETDNVPALENRRDQLKHQIQEARSQQANLQRILDNHRQCLRQLAEMEPRRQESEAQLRRWQHLDEALGSPDGSKMRQAGLHRLLEALLRPANHHLHLLCPRYSLRMGDAPLSLEILDHNRLSLPCPLHTLGRSEKFIISLAMALGWSSMQQTLPNAETILVEDADRLLDKHSIFPVKEALTRWQRATGQRLLLHSPNAASPSMHASNGEAPD